MTHEDRTRMEPDPELRELNPYYGGNENEENEMRWRDQWEIEEWAYDQGFESGIKPLWEYLGHDELSDIGRQLLAEGPEGAKALVDEMVNETADRTADEYLSDYVDGQLRLFAGYDVAENGDTLEEGNYSTWTNLRKAWECGFTDKLRGNTRYENLPEGGF